jgi:hypothetical protein
MMIQVALALVLATCAAADRGGSETQQKTRHREEKTMSQDLIQVLSSSQDSNELFKAAAHLILSTNPEDHQILLRYLSQEGFLGRLDSPKDYRNRASFLRVARILRALKESSQASARQILVGLTEATGFTANWDRADLLIQAVVIFRPPPPPVLKFWDDRCQPEDSFMHLTVRALVENGTEPAMALLQKKFAQPGFEDEERLWWMRTSILTHRYDLPLLRACQRMLLQGLPEHLRPSLVEALFDFRSFEWHGPDNGYTPPPLDKASPEARGELVKIGEYALSHLQLPEMLKNLVEEKVADIKKMK